MVQRPYTPRYALHAQEIKLIFKLGKRVLRSEGLDVIVHPSLHAFGRVLVVTSSKIGSAPWRNKIRRRIKAIFFMRKLYQAKLDCIVIVKKPGIAYTYAQLEQILCPLFAPRS